MDREEIAEHIAEAANNVTRISRNVAYVASAVVSSSVGDTASATSLSQYQIAMSDMLGYRKRMVASKIHDQTPRQAIQQSIARRLGGGIRAPVLPIELLSDIPEPRTKHSLFQTFNVTAPAIDGPEHQNDVTGSEFAISVRKEMAASELQDIDEQISALRSLRKVVFDRMADVECEQSTDERTLQHYYPRGEVIKKFELTTDCIRAVDFNSPFGQLALAAGSTVYLNELSNDQSTKLTGNGNKVINCLSVFGNDPLVICGAGHSVYSWRPNDVDGPCEPAEFFGHVGDVTVVDNDGETLVTSSLDSTVRIWDERLGKCVTTMDMFEFGGCSSLHHVGNALATGTADGTVRLFDMRQPVLKSNGKVNIARELQGGHQKSVTAIYFQNLELASGSKDGSLRLWDLRTSEINLAESYTNKINSLQLDSAKIVANVNLEMGVRVISRPTGGHRISASSDSPVTAAKYMKGYLVTGRANGNVGIWAV